MNGICIAHARYKIMRRRRYWGALMSSSPTPGTPIDNLYPPGHESREGSWGWWGWDFHYGLMAGLWEGGVPWHFLSSASASASTADTAFIYINAPACHINLPLAGFSHYAGSKVGATRVIETLQLENIDSGLRFYNIRHTCWPSRSLRSYLSRLGTTIGWWRVMALSIKFPNLNS